jgi:hypothetical protein
MVALSETYFQVYELKGGAAVAAGGQGKAAVAAAAGQGKAAVAAAAGQGKAAAAAAAKG